MIAKKIILNLLQFEKVPNPNKTSNFFGYCPINISTEINHTDLEISMCLKPVEKPTKDYSIFKDIHLHFIEHVCKYLLISIVWIGTTFLSKQNNCFIHRHDIFYAFFNSQLHYLHFYSEITWKFARKMFHLLFIFPRMLVFIRALGL